MFVDQPPDCTPLVEQTRHWPASGSKDDVRRFLELSGQRRDCERLSQAGWSTITEVAESGRQVRRASFEEGRLAFRVPAVELERSSLGTVEVRLSIDRPVRVFSAQVPAEIWGDLTAEDTVARQPRPPTLGAKPDPSVVFCHGWFVTLEAADEHQSWVRAAHQCQATDGPAVDYGMELAQIAIEFIPHCTKAKSEMDGRPPAEENVLWALISCAGRAGPKFLD